jgi:hypothetical protein
MSGVYEGGLDMYGHMAWIGEHPSIRTGSRCRRRTPAKPLVRASLMAYVLGLPGLPSYSPVIRHHGNTDNITAAPFKQPRRS